MVSTDDAILIFNKWAEELTPLLLRTYSPLYTQSMLCGLDAVKDGEIRLRVQGLGHIEIRLAKFTFEYFDPATHRKPLEEEESEKPIDTVASGAGIIGTAATGESFILLEIIFT